MVLRLLFTPDGSLEGMKISKHRTAVALTAAIALASGAYALGSQAGDGAAVAANGAGDRDRSTFRHRVGPPAFDGLADRLGVEEDALRDAMRDLRGAIAPPGPPGEDFAKELADELGTTEAKVEAALERVRDRHARELESRHAELAEQLAKRLKLDASDVEEALEDFGPPRLELRHP
jgi:nucleoid DNA-binding protein